MSEQFDSEVTAEEKTFVLLSGKSTEYFVKYARNAKCENRNGVYFHAELTTDPDRKVGFPFNIPSPVAKTGIKNFLYKNKLYLRIPYISEPSGYKWLCFLPTRECPLAVICHFIDQFNHLSLSYHQNRENSSHIGGD